MSTTTATNTTLPKIVRLYSHADDELLALVEALLEYEHYNIDRFEQACRRLWPESEVYRGHTHLRFMPFGRDRHGHYAVSFYVEKEGASQIANREMAYGKHLAKEGM